MRWQMSFDFCRRTTYLFCTNIYCSNLHTPEHHLEKVWSWWRESSASKSYLYQPVRSTDSCPHIGKVQHTVPEEPIVRLLRKPKSAPSQQYAPCPPFLPVNLLGSHGQVNGVTRSLMWPREEPCTTGEQLGDLHNSLLIRLVTSQAAHFDTRDLVNLRRGG